MTTKKKIFSPAANSECLCGSGKKYKRCCSGNLPDFDIGKKAKEAVHAGDYEAALIWARGDVAQYTIWHKTNTAPLLLDAQSALLEPVQKLLEVDVNALGAYVGVMRFYYERLGRAEEFPEVLERLRTNINHQKWQRKVAYLHVLEALGPSWNVVAGRREFRKLGSMNTESDVEILQLYIDLFGEGLEFSRRQMLAGRIISLTHSNEEKFHYRCFLALQHWMIGDVVSAESALVSAIDDYAEARDKAQESLYALSHYASAHMVLGFMRKDNAVLDFGITLFRQLIERDEFTAEGFADAYRQLGDALRYRSAWGEANDAYLAAMRHFPREVFNVFLAECACYLEGADAAQKLLDTVSVSALTSPEFIDYVFILSQIAIERGDQDALKKAEMELRGLKIKEPYFVGRKNDLLMSVIDTQRAGPSSERTESVRKAMAGGVSAMLRYIKLEPNLMGIGINVSKILQDVADRAGKKVKKG